MNELQNSIMKTPIEIALGIGEDGMTTAKRLYEFLELNPGNYAKWYRTNITENEFATENEDYWVFVLKEENPQGGRPSQDFKLTARFAKKLSMLQKNVRGEQAREYFTHVEDGMKTIAGRFQSLSPELRAILLHDEKIQQVSSKLQAVNEDLQQFKGDMPILGIEEDRITTAVKRRGVQCLGGKHSNAYNDKSLRGKLYSDLYKQVYRQFGITTYKAIKRNQCGIAIGIIESYEPPFIIAEQIAGCNAQMNLETEVA